MSVALADLRLRLARLEGHGRQTRPGDAMPGALPLAGLPLAAGGLARAAFHEVLADAPGSGAAFCATLLGASGGRVLWITAGSGALQPWPPGLLGCGLPPERLLLAQAPHWPDALWAMEEALRCPGLAATLLVAGWDGEPAPLDLTASRRLQLAAEAGGGIGLLLRPVPRQAGEGMGQGVLPGPSAATTRWRVAPRPDGLASPRWSLTLLRQRGGAPGGPWPVAWHGAAAGLVREP
ncbi:ImuA family protein [Roseomonas sp. USHLN139]|uniref:ImuA family protein n=1 Tax=Roseomonas sp. USHLN139 TaxID=3081298 RepID=UPI003B02B509